MTKRPASHTLEARSRDRIRAVLHDAGLVVEDLHQDYGEDMLVRVFRDGKATTPYSFFVQVKATASAATKGVRLTTAHVQHWQRFVQPVFVVLWNAHTGKVRLKLRLSRWGYQEVALCRVAIIDVERTCQWERDKILCYLPN